MKKYKALMLDLDGTTIPNREDGTPSKKVIDAIAKASKILHVGVATARPLFMLNDIAKSLSLSGPSIISAGSQIIDFPSQKILWEKTIDKRDFTKICETLNKFKVSFSIEANNKDTKFSNNYITNKPFFIYCFDVIQNEMSTIIEEISQIPTVAVHKIPSWIDGKVGFVVSDALATKQHGIFEVAKLLNIETHKIIGVGDGYNDFPLLMACGLKIAMGNAVEELREIADFIAPTVEKDGVAWVIEKFVLNKNS